MHEFVVPKSMPITFAIELLLEISILGYLSSDGASAEKAECNLFMINYLYL